ncbi:MAG: AMP-binding protein [Thermoanaerobaculia bacterium]
MTSDSASFPRLAPRRLVARTLPGLLVGTAQRQPERLFLRFLEPPAVSGGQLAAPRRLSRADFAVGVGRAAHFLRSVGVGPGDRVLLLAENSPEWQMVALGAQLLRAEPAAVFSSLGAETVSGIARRVAPRVIFVSTAEQWDKLAPAAPELVADGLAAVMARDRLAPASMPPGLAVVALAAITGDQAPGLAPAEMAALAAAVGDEDPFLLLFTSGTTGRPKGVRLPQRAMVHALDAGQASVATTESDVGLHFLPFGHIAGHAQFTLALAQGHELIMVARREDLEPGLALSPTYFFSVPLVYERMRDAVEAKMAALSPLLRRAVRAVMAAAVRHRVEGSRSLGDFLGACLADLLVGRALRARLGGRVRGLFAGGAPASPALFRFFEGLGIPLVELYGMSETAGMISSNLLAGPRRESCAGLITADHEVRFGADGELQVRGPLLLTGFLEPEDGAQAWTADGYFRTGDLGRVDEHGFLYIEGRCKSLIMLSTGKKLSPEPIELALAATAPFHGAVLFGEGRPFVAAAVFVAREELARLAAAGEDAATALLARARAALAAFSDFEKPKRLLVLPGTPQDYPELLTPTLKIKRGALLAAYGPAVAELFLAR